MKQISIFLITLYQRFISPTVKSVLGLDRICRFSPSCSEYTKTNIKKYGIIRGGYNGFVRILHCQPLYSPAH